MTLELVIVGGGIAGLNAALIAENLGLNFALLEASERYGGSICTERLEGGLIADCGPNSLLPGKVLTKIINDLSLDLLQADPTANAKLIYSEKGFIDVTNPRELFLHPDFLSFETKWSILSEGFRSFDEVEEADLSVAAFFEKHFTAELVSKLIHPILSGIYAGQAENLSMKSVFPRIWQWEQGSGSIFRGLLGDIFRSGAPRKRRIYTFEGGLESLTQAMVRWISPENRFLHYPVPNVSFQNERWHIHSPDREDLIAETLLLAVPPWAAASIYPSLLSGLGQIPIASISTFTFWLPKDECSVDFHKLFRRGFGFLSTAKAPTRLLGMIFSSGIFPQRSPEDHLAITCFMGGMADTEFNVLPHPEQKQLAIDEVGRITGCRPILKTSRLWEKGIPQYQVGHGKFIENLQQSLPDDLALAGNFLRGVSLEETAVSSLDAMKKLGFI